MWTKVNQTYSTHHSQNCWAHLADTNKWHKIVTGNTSGVTNLFVQLCSAKANDKQVYVKLDSSNNITTVYM